MAPDPLLAVEREAARLHQLAPWISIRPSRDAAGVISAEVTLTGSFKADPGDLAGSLIREIHRRLDEFESKLDD
jgi:hypothetical protein